MLNKLLKYDMKYLNRYMMPLYVLSIISSIISRVLFSYMDTSIVIKVFAIVTSAIANTLLANVLIHTIIRIVSRYTNNLYKDESYLTHTLPVERKDIFKSKFIMATIYSVLSLVIVLGCIAIEYYTKDRFETIKAFILPVIKQTGFKNTTFIAVISLYIFFMIEYLMLMMFNAITLGYRSESNKGIMSFVYAVILYMITQVSNLIVLFISSIFNKNIKDIFVSNVATPSVVKSLFITILVCNFIYIIAYYISGKKLLKNKLNVE